MTGFGDSDIELPPWGRDERDVPDESKQTVTERVQRARERARG